MSKETTCQICNKIFKSYKGVSSHIRIHNIKIEEYYIKYLKRPDDDICKTCGKDTSFKNINEGYFEYCSTKCVANNPDIIIKRTDSYIQWCEDNPEKSKERGMKGQQTRIDNPEILERQLEKRKQTFRKNPKLQLEATRKSVKTRMKNPEKFKEIGNKIAISRRNMYKELKKDDSSIPYYLYITNHEYKPIIKIGITTSLERRMKEINRDFGNTNLEFSLENIYNTLSSLEDYLHEYFKDHCKVQPSGDGRTEWFDECILEDVIQLINESSNKLIQ